MHLLWRKGGGGCVGCPLTRSKRIHVCGGVELHLYLLYLLLKLPAWFSGRACPFGFRWWQFWCEKWTEWYMVPIARLRWYSA